MRPSVFLLCLLGLGLGLGACRDESPVVVAPGASGASPVQQANVGADDAARQAREAERALNPEGLPVYAGPVGSVRGVVRVRGDAPPLVAAMVEKLPPDDCPRAHELHRKLYRQGAGRSLADVLVTVTEYKGYLPRRGEAVRVEAKGCAFDGRIIAMTFGQRLDIYNLDAQAYVPRLVGTPSYALRVAMPGGNPVPIFAPQAGKYMVVDQTRDYMRSDLFVLNYPTFDVTGLDGAFEITGIPVGNVKVTAYAPALGKVVDQRVEVEAGVTTELAFEIAFSESEYQERLKSAPDTAH